MDGFPLKMMKFFKGGVTTSGCVLSFVLFRHATAYILTSPKNTVAFMGEKVILECSTNLSTPVRWIYESTVAVYSATIYYNEVITESLRSKYEIETSSRGTYNLIIKKVELSYAGIYRCFPTVYPGERESAVSAQLTVLASEPLCGTNTSSLSRDSVEGDAIQMWCSISFAGCWRPAMGWHKSNGENVDRSVTLNETNLFVTSSLNIQLKSGDNDVTYSFKIHFSSNSTCPRKEEDIRATNIPDFHYIWNYTLNVLYGPRNIRLYPIQTSYEIGDSISCSADGNPTPAYEWTDNRNGSRDDIHGSILSVDETMESDQERIFRCTATNVVAGKRKNISETVKFNVTDNHRRRAVQIFLLFTCIALPIVCFAVLFALTVYLINRFRDKATTQNQDIAERHEYETVSESNFQGRGSCVVMNESRERQETNTNDAYMDLTETQPVLYSQLHIYVNQNEDIR